MAMDPRPRTGPRRLVSAPLEALGRRRDDGIALHAVQSGHPHVQRDAAQAPATSSCYTESALVTATTPFHNAAIVEVRTFLCTTPRANAAPHHILFPAPLLDGVHLSNSAASDSGTVLLQACTVTGYAYRIVLPLDSLHSVDDVPQRWIREHRIAAVPSSDVKGMLRDKTLSLSHVSEDGSLMLVACADGRVIKLAWHGSEHTSASIALDGHWEESILHSHTFLSRFFARSTAQNSATQISSMSTYARSSHWSGTLALIVSQDRKLRLWDLGTDTCVRAIDLPQSSTADHIEDTREEYDAVLVDGKPIAETSSTSMTRSAQIRAFSLAQHDGSSAHALYALVYVPSLGTWGDFLACYGIQLTAASSSSSRQFAGSVGDVDLVWRKRCDPFASRSDSELRDISLVRNGPLVEAWCLWDASGSTMIKFTTIDVHLAHSNPSSDSDWHTVALPCSHSPLQGVALDDDMCALSTAEEIAPFMAARIFEPNRFSSACLDYGVDAYENIIQSHVENLEYLLPTSFEQASVRDQILQLVGVAVDLQIDPTTGAPKLDEYFAAVKREWCTFVGLLQEYDSRERWPIGFANGMAAHHDDLPLVLSRGCVGLAVREDSASTLWRLSRDALREQTATLAGDLHFVSAVEKEIHPRIWASFETDLLDALSSQPSSPVEDVSMELWEVHVSSSISDELTDSLRQDGVDIERALALIAECLLCLQLRNPNAGAGTAPTELESALGADMLTQAIADRFRLTRLLVQLSLAARQGAFGGDEAHDEYLDSLIAESVTLFHRYYVYDFAAHRDATVEVRASEPVLEDDEGDTHAVEKQMRDMQFRSPSIEGADDNQPRFATNLVHMGILRRYLLGASTRRLVLTESVAEVAYSTLDLITPSRGLATCVDLDLPTIRFIHHTVREGCPGAALGILRFFAPSPASDYVKARATLLLGDIDSAAGAFERVALSVRLLADTYCDESIEALRDILPPLISGAGSGEEALMRFYRLVVLYFQQAKSSLYVAQFVRLATELLSAGIPASTTTAQSLYLLLFQSNLMLWRFDEAYVYLLAIPFDDLQRECLRSLISVMCEKGFVEQLLAYNFAGMQGEVERTLSFKARNSDPLADVLNYYDVLYAFHLRRGDLKSAGATMWQMGKRVNDLARRHAIPARSVRLDGPAPRDLKNKQQYAILEAQCFLKSINVLTLIAPADAWFAYEMSGDDDEELVESSKLTTFVPAASFHKAAHEIRIVYLDDIRRHYQILVAYLELLALWPEDAIPAPRSASGTLAAFTMLFVQRQDFERAFSFAHSVGTDRTQIYTALTDRCLELTRWVQTRRDAARVHAGTAEGDSEHPLVQALLDDDDEGSIGSLFAGQGPEAGVSSSSSAPNVRFLERSDRCAQWTGPPHLRAWRYLRLWLSMEDEKEPSVHYRVTVLAHILARQQWLLTPAWLLRWLRQYQAEALVRVLVDHDIVVDALREAITMVQASTTSVTAAAKPPRVDKLAVHAGASWLPYLLLDELLQRAEGAAAPPADGGKGRDSPAAAAGQDAVAERRELATQLRRAIDTRKTQLARIETDERRSVGEGAARRQRLADQQEQQRLSAAEAGGDTQMGSA